MMAAGHDDEVLLAGDVIDHRGGLAAGGQRIGPQGLAGLHVNGTELVVGGGGDKDEPARDEPALSLKLVA